MTPPPSWRRCIRARGGCPARRVSHCEDGKFYEAQIRPGRLRSASCIPPQSARVSAASSERSSFGQKCGAQTSRRSRGGVGMWSSATTAGVSPRPCGYRRPAAKPCSAPSPLASEKGGRWCGLLLLDSFEIQIGGWKNRTRFSLQTTVPNGIRRRKATCPRCHSKGFCLPGVDSFTPVPPPRGSEQCPDSSSRRTDPGRNVRPATPNR